MTGLDLGADLLAFVWQPRGAGVFGDGGYEVRADRLRDGRSLLVGSGSVGEVCAGGSDGAVPSSPTAEGPTVWYAMLNSSCYRYTAELRRYRTEPFSGSRGPLAGIVLQVVRDGQDLYALIAPKNACDTARRAPRRARPASSSGSPTAALAHHAAPELAVPLRLRLHQVVLRARRLGPTASVAGAMPSPPTRTR